MHGNRRYVKLTLIGLVLAFGSASPAEAELVTAQATEGVLTAAGDGKPYVAYTVGRALFVRSRDRQGRWLQTRLGRLPGANVTLAGIRVSERPRRSVSVLAEDRLGSWIALSREKRISTIARAARGSSFGPAGLALDARGRPAVAYAVRRPSANTFLRLVTFGAGGRQETRPITQKGFPPSALPPGAAPVLVSGRLHVVETYTSAAIDWAPQSGGGWEGQYLFASRLGTPQGRVGAVFLAPTLWSAWTQVSSDTVVLLTSSADTQATWALTHGIFVALAQGDQEPEVAAYDWVTPQPDWFVYAGLVVRGPRSEAWQLDGRIEGYTIDRAGAHQLLLFRAGQLEWFETPSPGLPRISIRMGPVDAEGKVSGTVVGAASGAVELYRELPHAPRQLVATAPVAADGSYAASGLDPNPSNVYRAVYVEPTTGIPFGFLPGVPVGTAADRFSD